MAATVSVAAAACVMMREGGGGGSSGSSTTPLISDERYGIGVVFGFEVGSGSCNSSWQRRRHQSRAVAHPPSVNQVKN